MIFKVGDKVRRGTGEIGTAVSIAHPSFSGNCIAVQYERRWVEYMPDGSRWGNFNKRSSYDVASIIRPGKTELITEANYHEIEAARSDKASTTY